MTKRVKRRTWKNYSVACTVATCGREIRVGTSTGADGVMAIEGWSFPCGHHHEAATIRALVEALATPPEALGAATPECPPRQPT